MLWILVPRLARRTVARACVPVDSRPLDVSRVALAEHLESAPCLDELHPSQDGNLFAGDLECMLRPLPQLDMLSETSGAADSCNGSEIEEKHTLVGKIHPSLPRISHRQTWVTCEMDSRCFCVKTRMGANECSSVTVHAT